MLGCFRMTLNLSALLGPPACSTCVIEVDVRDENLTNLGFIQSQLLNTGPQSLQRGTRSCFHQSQFTLGFDHVGGDQAGPVLEMQIKGMNGHRQGLIDDGFVFDFDTFLIEVRQKIFWDGRDLGI